MLPVTHHCATAAPSNKVGGGSVVGEGVLSIPLLTIAFLPKGCPLHESVDRRDDTASELSRRAR